MTECERRDCSETARVEVVYTDPAESVEYCEEHARWARAEFDFESIVRL